MTEVVRIHPLPPEQEPTEWSVLVWILYDSGGSKIAYSKKFFTDYRTTGSGLTRTTLKRSFFIESGALFKIL